MTSTRGFTLIEVMVALVVFAVVSVALVKNTTLSLRQTGEMEARSVAWWLAENQMTRLRLLPKTDEDYPVLGMAREDVDMNEVLWEIETRVEATDNDDVRRVVVSVYEDGNTESRAELIGFIGRY